MQCGRSVFGFKKKILKLSFLFLSYIHLMTVYFMPKDVFTKNSTSARGKNRTCSCLKALYCGFLNVKGQQINSVIQSVKRLIFQFAQNSDLFKSEASRKVICCALYTQVSTGDPIGLSMSAGALLYSSALPSKSNYSLVKQTFYSLRCSCLPELFAVM